MTLGFESMRLLAQQSSPRMRFVLFGTVEFAFRFFQTLPRGGRHHVNSARISCHQRLR